MEPWTFLSVRYVDKLRKTKLRGLSPAANYTDRTTYMLTKYTTSRTSSTKSTYYEPIRHKWVGLKGRFRALP
jgi:hypothetical protein